MEIKKYIIAYLLLMSFVFSLDKIVGYKINYFGIHVADCTISVRDTIYNNLNAKKIKYNVDTKYLFDIFFPLKNRYLLIVNELNEILYFKKDTSQPKVSNYLETELINNRVYYKGTSIEIKNNYYNIFSLLYSLINTITMPEKFILEREGELYDASINKNKNMEYILNLSKKNNHVSLIENTDIFTWAVFMKDAKRKIIVNEQLGVIKKCVFRKGIVLITATLDYIK
jgi:hypothetical protein